MKYCFKQMDKNFCMVSVSSDPVEDISAVLSRPQAAREQNCLTNIASNSEVMTDMEKAV